MKQAILAFQHLLNSGYHQSNVSPPAIWRIRYSKNNPRLFWEGTLREATFLFPSSLTSIVLVLWKKMKSQHISIPQSRLTVQSKAVFLFHLLAR